MEISRSPLMMNVAQHNNKNSNYKTSNDLNSNSNPTDDLNVVSVV